MIISIIVTYKRTQTKKLQEARNLLRCFSKKIRMECKGKVVLVTGGAMGIGKAIARSFLERGAKVSICDLNVEEGRKTVEEFTKEFGQNRVILTECDVSKDKEFEAAYNICEKSLGTIDILINNAGIQHKDLKKLEAVNFEAPVRGTELAISKMGKHNGGKGGHVVNIGSIVGLAPFPYFPYYSALKAALIHFTRIMGGKFHYSYTGVSVLCLCPGGINTSMNTSDILERTAYNDFAAKKLSQFKHSLDLIEPKEIGEGVVRLIEENKSGEVVLVDKGYEFTYFSPSLSNSALGLDD